MNLWNLVLGVLITSNLWAQEAAIIQRFNDLYPDLPALVTDADLRTCISNQTHCIPKNDWELLSLMDGHFVEKQVGLGKIATPKTTIYLTAEVRQQESDAKYKQLVLVSGCALDNKTGERVGTVHYMLTMSGNDALNRQGQIEYDRERNLVQFTIRSEKKDMPNIFDTQIQTYKIKTTLEYSARAPRQSLNDCAIDFLQEKE